MIVAGALLECDSAIIDGEMIVQIVGAEIDRRGIPIAILAKETEDALAFAGGAEHIGKSI